MTRNTRLASLAIGVVVTLAAVVYVFVAPTNRTAGVRIGGVLTPAPSDRRTVNDAFPIQLKTGGFSPVGLSVAYVGWEDGVITEMTPDGGFWAR